MTARPSGATGEAFVAVRRAQRYGVLARSLAPAFREQLLDGPDVLLEEGRVLKDDAAGTVVALEGTFVDGVAVLLKRVRASGLRALRRSIGPCRVRRAHEAALRLDALGIPSAAPLGWIAQRERGVLRASWLLSALLPGTDAGSLLAGDGATARETADTMRALHARLLEAGLVHGDLKATNFVGDPSRLALVDLHALRPARGPLDPGLRRDRLRLQRNFLAIPALRDSEVPSQAPH